MKPISIKILAACIGFAVAIAAVFAYNNFFGAPQKQGDLERFVVQKNATRSAIIETLKTQGFIKNTGGFSFALSRKNTGEIPAGAYKISKAMNAWQTTNVFAGKPYMKWITIPEGFRKEEIADLLAKELGWTSEEKEIWLTKDTAEEADYTEGVYFPDTYLIPVDEPTAEVAKRLRAKFEETFAPYAKEALKQNIRWPTLIRVASLIQREAAGKDDMPLIAGVIWNRLLKEMKLDIDATIQYIKGDEKDGWWPKIKPEDKMIDSPYNTYKYKGLPPRPIANPGIKAIEAALRPEKTKCFYYLHDKSKTIHCAETFEGHKANIEKYLR